MSFIDDTIVTAKELLDVASKKTAEAVEVQKLRLAVAKKKSELSKSFETIGRTYYQNRSGEMDQDILDELCEEIGLQLEQLAQLNEQLDAAKNIRICPGCGRKNPADSGFCNGCGNKI